MVVLSGRCVATGSLISEMQTFLAVGGEVEAAAHGEERLEPKRSAGGCESSRSIARRRGPAEMTLGAFVPPEQFQGWTPVNCTTPAPTTPRAHVSVAADGSS